MKERHFIGLLQIAYGLIIVPPFMVLAVLFILVLLVPAGAFYLLQSLEKPVELYISVLNKNLDETLKQAYKCIGKGYYTFIGKSKSSIQIENEKLTKDNKELNKRLKELESISDTNKKEDKNYD